MMFSTPLVQNTDAILLITAQRCSLRVIEDLNACHLWYAVISAILSFTGLTASSVFMNHCSAGGP